MNPSANRVALTPKEFFSSKVAPLLTPCSHDAQGGVGTENPEGVDRIPMSAGIYCTFREKERRWASNESTKGNVSTHGSTMKDGCEYVSGIGNTGRRVRPFYSCKFQLLISFILRYGHESSEPWRDMNYEPRKWKSEIERPNKQTVLEK